MFHFKDVLLLGFFTLSLLSCRQDATPDLKINSDIAQRLQQFAPVEIATDISFLPDNEKQALVKLIEASKYMDEIFLRQAWQKNPEYRKRLTQMENEEARNAFAYFKIMFGPWDRLDEHERPFVGTVERPPGAGYYPTDMTEDEFNAFLQAHPEKTDEFKNEFTMIRRDDAGNLMAVPYSQMFKQGLEPAAKLMREAADLTQNKSLATFLRARADAFFSNNYRESDMAWMDLDSPVEITIGPYEVYEDKLFGYKAAFESFVTVTDPEESQKLARYKSELPAMERNLPIPDEIKNFNRGTASPIRVVDEVFTAGDTKSGIQTIAFNLPNDEVVREKKGSKKVLLRNVIAAKYDQILKPIAKKLIAEDQVQYVTADAFTNEVLFHELSHGLGPGKIKVDGRDTEVRLELKDLYSATEEAKADIMGVYNIHYMIEKGLLPESLRQQIAVTYLAGLFRSTRFGISEAHGKGTILQFNYMMEKGGINYDPESETFSVDIDKFEGVVEDLVHDIAVLQAGGDYDGTLAMFDKYVHMPKELAGGLEKLQDIPVDIVPRYTLADRLTNGTVE